MSPLGYGVIFFLVVVTGLCWLGLSLSVRLERCRTRCPLEQAVDMTRDPPGHPAWIWNFMGGAALVLLAGGSAAVLGRLAMMSAADAESLFAHYPVLLSCRSLLMGAGPIICVVLSAVGVSLLVRTLERCQRRY